MNSSMPFSKKSGFTFLMSAIMFGSIQTYALGSLLNRSEQEKFLKGMGVSCEFNMENYFADSSFEKWEKSHSNHYSTYRCKLLSDQSEVLVETDTEIFSPGAKCSDSKFLSAKIVKLAEVEEGIRLRKAERQAREEAEKNRLKYSSNCKARESSVEKVTPVQPSIWNGYKKETRESSTALCFEVKRSDGKSAKACSRENPNHFGRYDIEDKIKALEGACRSLINQEFIFKPDFEIHIANFCARSGSCEKVVVKAESLDYK